ncbi:MAG: efflux RND transporter periplasmic adaptor subunit [Devosia sp.]|nr:efflux RND transporter periplasmic adaptor subunit [Devosia sp.]
MRAFFSGLTALLSRLAAPIIVICVGLYFLSGSLVQGGNGPGNGEKSLLAVVTGSAKVASLDDKVAHEPTGGETVDPSLTIAQRVAAAQTAAPVRSVEVTTFIAKAMPIDVPLRGQTKAKATLTAMAETSGTISQVNVVKGQVVKPGDLLCTLDTETRQASVAQAEASLAQANANVAQAQADYDTNQLLIKSGSATPNSSRSLGVSLASAKASLASAQASLDSAVTELGRTKIVAKIGGVIQDPIATVGSVMAPSAGVATCATIVQLDPIVFSGAVPESHINYAKTGLSASVTTVTGETLQGTVTYVSSVADAATRTFPAEIEMPNPGNKVPAGLTATATINVGTAPAQLLPQSVLTLDDSGTMGVRAVDSDNKVVFYPVTIVQDAREGMYVTGLPLKVDVITTGQEFVKSGDTVKAVQAKDNNGAPIAATTSNGALS